MFCDYRPNWKVIFTILIVLTIMLYSLVLVLFGTELSTVIRALLKAGFIMVAISLLWYKLENSWWLCPIFRGWLIRTPDLRGRWVGNYVSSYDNKTRPMTLEIRQTLLHLQCVAFGPNNKAEGYSARLLSDKLKENFKLAYLFHAKRTIKESIPGDEHEGVTILEYIPNSPKRLKGMYINDRDKDPRKADVYLEWESYELKNEL